MHEKRQQGNEVRILPVQCGVGFQAYRVPATREVSTAFVFDAGDGRDRNTFVICKENFAKGIDKYTWHEYNDDMPSKLVIQKSEVSL